MGGLIGGAGALLSSEAEFDTGNLLVDLPVKLPYCGGI